MQERIYYCTLTNRARKSYAVHTVESLKAQCEQLGDCLVWQGYVANQTPKVSVFGEGMSPVRKLFAELLGNRKFAKGVYFYASSCGDPLCVAPAHTIRRSRSQQIQAMNKALRNNAAAELIRRVKMSEGRRRVTAEMIEEIMTSPDTGKDVAIRLGISKSCVSKYRRGERGVVSQRNPFAGLMA